MNVGSAKRWVEALLNPSIRMNDGSCLRFDDDRSLCLIGVLEEVATDEWKAGSWGASENKDGSIGTLSRMARERCKCKTDMSKVADAYSEHFHHLGRSMWGRGILAKWIMDNYRWM